MVIDSAFAPDDNETDEHLARAWIRRQRAWIERESASNDTFEWESLDWTWERFRYLTEYLPDKAWRVIKLIISMDNSAEIIKNLTDGPLEDLLQNFGIDMIDIVEDEISRLLELHTLLTYYVHELDERKAIWVRSDFHGRARDGSIGQQFAPHDDERDDDLARAWIAIHQEERNSDRSNALWWANDRMGYLIDYLPQKAWRLILLIWSIDQSTTTMGMLSAGPIENLLSEHGPEIISLVEAEAQRNATFAKLLGGVWKFGMTDEIWARLQAVWDRCGWDGIPET